MVISRQPSAAYLTGRMMLTAIAAHRLSRSAPADAAALLQHAQYPITEDQRHPFGSAAGDPHHFTGLRTGKSMTFSLPGAMKISGRTAARRSTV